MNDKLARTLSTESIRHECSQSNLVRAQSYFAQKRLVEFTINNEYADSVSIVSKVKGTSATPYKQLISIKWQADQQNCRIVGQCSCPMGYNCKHVATACLEYQAMLSKTSPVNTKACFEWLESFQDAPATEPTTTVSAKEFLIYILTINPNNQSLQVKIQVSRYKVNGQLAKAKEINLTNIRYNLNYGNSAPAYLTEGDQEILKLLLSTGVVNQPVPVRDWAGALALEKMLRTERLFLEEQATMPITRGEVRPLVFSWELNTFDAYQLKIQTEPPATIVATEPAYYLDSLQNQLGELDYCGLNDSQLQKLLVAPPVPKEVADEFSDRLLKDIPQLNLPTPTQVELIDLSDLQPAAHLKLMGAGDKKHYVHHLQLSFVYGQYPITAKAGEAFSLIATDNGYVRIKRDSQFEQDCQNLLLDAGFYQIDLKNAHDLRFIARNNQNHDDGQIWHDFLDLEMPALESEGWTITRDPSFLLDFQVGEAWEAELNSDDNNWFDMSFSIELDGKKLPLLPLLIPVIQNFELERLPNQVTLPLGNHQFLTINSDKLKPFLKILYEIFDRNTVLEGNNLRLSRFDIVNIAELESNSYGMFALKGGEAIRALSQKIKNFSGIDQVLPPTALQAELRHYQQHGLNWLQFLREYQFGGILADDMGLGKTLQTLAHLLLEKQQGRISKPCLIIAPTSLMSNWRREAERFAPDLKLLVLQGLERRTQFDKIQDFDVLLTTYPLLPRDEEFLLAQNYYYLILDEAQIVKNPNAKAAKVVRYLKADHRLCLTGMGAI